MSGGSVRLEDRVRWNAGRPQLVLSTHEILALSEVMRANTTKDVFMVLVKDVLVAAHIADKAIANMISSADFHP